MYYTSSYPCRDPSIKEIVTTKMVTMRCLVSGTRVDSTPARARSWPPELRVTVPVTVHYIIPPALISDSLSGRLRARSLHEVAIVAIVAGPHAKNVTMRVRPSCVHVGHPSLNDPRAHIGRVASLAQPPRPRFDRSTSGAHKNQNGSTSRLHAYHTSTRQGHLDARLRIEY